jgi:hypothetical protein
MAAEKLLMNPVGLPLPESSGNSHVITSGPLLSM